MCNYNILRYIVAIINNKGKFTVCALAQILGNIGHDKLTRMLHQDWNPQKLLWYCIQRIHPLTSGWLIIDDTWCPKCFSAICSFVKKQYSGKYKIPLMGMTVVMLLWTDGKWRIPIGIRIWIKGGKTKPQLALEMLSQVRNWLLWRPLYVLMDAGYATKGILRLIHNYGWTFICQCACSRHFGGVKLKHYKFQAYWTAVDKAWFGHKVKAIRVKDRFYICNRLSWSRETILNTYTGRVIIEETFRVLKQELGFVGCQLGDEASYSRHLHLSLIAFIVLEAVRIKKQKQDEETTIYKVRRNVIFRKSLFRPPVLKRFSVAA